MAPRVQYKTRGGSHAFGEGTSFSGSDWNKEHDAECPFCGAQTKMIQNRLAQHNCYGFACPAVGKTYEQAASIVLNEDGSIEGEEWEEGELDDEE